MKCIKCENKATVFIKHSGLYFCDSCFISFIQEKIRKYLSKKIPKIKERPKILILISGGKDSFVLLHSVVNIFKDKYEIKGLYIDEGIPNYSEKMRQRVEKYAKKILEEIEIVSYKEFTGFTMEEILNYLRKTIKNFSPCTFCTIIKRRIIDEYAKRNKIDYILTGHTLDDYVVSGLINIYTGNINRMIRLFSEDRKLYSTYGIPIKLTPLREVSVEETKIYCKIIGIDINYGKCTFKEGIRLDIENYLDIMEKKYPGLKINTFKTLEKIVNNIKNNIELPELKVCKKCGFPSSMDMCSYCKIMEVLRNEYNKNSQ